MEPNGLKFPSSLSYAHPSLGIRERDRNGSDLDGQVWIDRHFWSEVAHWNAQGLQLCFLVQESVFSQSHMLCFCIF